MTEEDVRKFRKSMDAMNEKLSDTHPGAPLFGNAATDYRLKQLEQSIADIKKYLGI